MRRRFRPLAANRDLELRVRPCKCYIYSDRNLLYRILQNFLANAIRYTESGGVLLGCQRRGNELLLALPQMHAGDVDPAAPAPQHVEHHERDGKRQQTQRRRRQQVHRTSPAATRSRSVVSTIPGRAGTVRYSMLDRRAATGRMFSLLLHPHAFRSFLNRFHHPTLNNNISIVHFYSQ